jgi:hypothetical protein
MEKENKTSRGSQLIIGKQTEVFKFTEKGIKEEILRKNKR